MELSFRELVWNTLILLNALYKHLKESDGEAAAVTLIQAIVEDACVDDLMVHINDGKKPIFIYEGEN